ncbi:MAG: class I SAM-dependent methyltransferase [Pseudolabrys sp.]|nr:class I SAM-dependent methyltransferase [Pseudolabrys sp.]
MTISPLADPRLEAVLARLHAEDKRQFRAILRHYLPRLLLSPFTGGAALDPTAPAEAAFLRDKLVAIDPDKGRLAYCFCRALDATLAVEIGTSFGVSTLYLAAALRDNAARDGGMRKVIGTEIEPSKAAAARANWAEAGLDAFIDLREGDALETLAGLRGPVDFVLIDTWIPLALPALKLLTPHLRRGAIVMCDNVRQFAKAYRPYTDHVRDPANGFRSMLWPGQGGVELSVWNG